MESLTIETNFKPSHPEGAVLRLKGILYASTLAQLDQAVQQALSEKRRHLVLDLSETSYVSSGGWSAFLRAAQALRKLGGDLFLSGMKAEVHDSFELLEYDKIIRLFNNPETAFREGLSPAKPA